MGTKQTLNMNNKLNVWPSLTFDAHLNLSNGIKDIFFKIKNLWWNANPKHVPYFSFFKKGMGTPLWD
jgi:hypothetical protein